MTESQCFMMAAYYRGKPDWDMVCCILLGWEMLLCMQSEGLCVYKGQDGDIFGDNPNGVWICPTTGDFMFKMKVRKNRRHGSTLRRACRCGGKPNDTNFCGACVLRQYLVRSGEARQSVVGHESHRLCDQDPQSHVYNECS